MSDSSASSSTATPPPAEAVINTAIQQRVNQIALIKAVLATVVFVIMLLTFRFPLPLTVSLLDLATVPLYLWLARRRPVAATYALVIATALALTPRQFVQGYVNGINWVLYLPLPLAAAYVVGRRQALIFATIGVLAVALPITLLAAVTLPPQISRVEVITLIAYLTVVLWGIAWLGGRLIDRSN